MNIVRAMTALNSGKITSEALLETCLENTRVAGNQSEQVFIRLYDSDSLTCQARLIDQVRSSGSPLPPCAGIPLSVKDLFDVKGEVTCAGSTVLSDSTPVDRDSLAIQRLRRAGFILVGRTNMTEFAYSGLGLNPHYGTPRNPYDRETGRIPGGSTSGGAISVTDGMALGALGTDTGGSCRIPAALCGIVGFKPTARRVPQRGVYPLSFSLDSVGPLAKSVSCCAVIDGVVAGEDDYVTPGDRPLKDLRLGVPQSLVLDGLDETVSGNFQVSLSRLSEAGAKIGEVALKELLDIPGINHKGGFAAAEAFALHKDMMAARSEQYDPYVISRIRKGEHQSAADYIELLNARARLQEQVWKASAGYDALIYPTVPIIAPAVAELSDPAVYNDINLLILRNPSVVNLLDGCAISVPCHEPGSAPTGLMVAGAGGTDEKVLSIGAAIEREFAVNSERGV